LPASSTNAGNLLILFAVVFAIFLAGF